MTQQSTVWKNSPISTTSTNAYYERKQKFTTSPHDVYNDIQSRRKNYIFMDVRSPEAFEAYHAHGAVNLPFTEITPENMAVYPLECRFVVYGWGIGSLDAAKAAYKLSAMGYHVKEMVGGIDAWKELLSLPTNEIASLVA